MAELTLNRIQAKIEHFKWKNYRRDFGKDRSAVLDIYWHCVTADLLTDNIRNDNKKLDQFNKWFFNSYSNCFYRSNELLHKIYELFEGYSSYNRFEKEEVAWEKWQEKTKRDMGTTLKSIADSVRSNYRLDERIYKKKKMVVDDLGAYDHWHEKLGLPISEFVIHHLKEPVKNSKYVKPINDFAGYVFQFWIDISLAESLHKLGQQHLEKSYIYYAMRMVGRQLEEGEKRFSTYLKMSTSDAVEHLEKHYPQFKSYSIPKKARLIRTKYRKPNREKLKLDSIKKNLRRKERN